MQITAAKVAGFTSLNAGYNQVFRPGRLSVGLVVPIESYLTSAVPTMESHIERAQLADELGFSALWLRDVPFNVPSFGDAGQTFDPFVYLGALAQATSRIALGMASLILPLRHPAHVAKAAATVDVLSNGRLILGIASGDRPEEYPALGIDFHDRGERFRESVNYIQRVLQPAPQFDSPYGRVGAGMEMLPRPQANRLPLLVTGSSQQSMDWIAGNTDGWMTYPRPASTQQALIKDYRQRIDAAGKTDKPVIEPLYIDLAEHPDTPPRPIHLGLHIGVNLLLEYLKSRQQIGVNHVALNLRFNQPDTEPTLRKLADEILPNFKSQD